MSWFILSQSLHSKRKIAALKKYFEKADQDNDGEISMEDWISELEKANYELRRYKCVPLIFSKSTIP